MPLSKHTEKLEGVQSHEINNNTISDTHTSACNTANNHDDKFDNPHHFRKGISRLLQQSTIHRLPYLSTSSNNVVRLIWFALWLTGAAGFSINLSYVIARYLTGPVLTSYHEDHEEFVWPDITFCNAMAPYGLNTQKSQALWNHYVDRARNLSTMNHVPKDLFGGVDNEFIIQSLLHSSIPYWRFSVGNVEDMFIVISRQMKHQGIRLSGRLDPELTQMKQPWEKYFYTQILQKSFNAPCLNFQIARYLNKSEMNEIEKVGFYMKTNLQSYLIINSSYYPHIIDVYITLPNHFPGTEVIELTPGHLYSVQLEMVRYQHTQKSKRCQDKKYSAIVYDADLTTKRLVYGDGEDLCHRLLSQYLYLRECRCYSPLLPYGYYPDLINVSYNINYTNTNESISQPVLCLNMSVFNEYQLVENAKCMHRVFKKYSEASLYMSLDKVKRCEHYAKSTYCGEVKYNHFGIVSNPIAELWGNAYNEARDQTLIKVFRRFENENISNSNNTSSNKHNASGINKTTSQNESTRQHIFYHLRNNFVKLVVERARPRGRLVREEDEYPFCRLLSDIGGNMGLWIGISVIGLFEFFELFGFIIYASIKYFKRLTMNSLKSQSFKVVLNISYYVWEILCNTNSIRFVVHFYHNHIFVEINQ